MIKEKNIISYFKKIKQFPDTITIGKNVFVLSNYDMGGYLIRYDGNCFNFDIETNISRYGNDGKLDKKCFNNLMIEIYG